MTMGVLACLVLIFLGVFLVLRSLPLRGCFYGPVWMIYGAVLMLVALLLKSGWLHL